MASDNERLYVVISEIIFGKDGRRVFQPAGRQIAQACHAVSGYRHSFMGTNTPGFDSFEPKTTIILQARDSAELQHITDLLLRGKINIFLFHDSNSEYGEGNYATALTCYASSHQISGILDYLPLWGSR
jgi:hypothetical protein